MRAVLLAIMLAGCSQATTPPEPTSEAAPAEASNAERALAQMPSWENARAGGVDFRAVGQEPGWMLDVYTDGRITLLWDYGERIAHFPPSQADTAQEGATRYALRTESHALAVTIRRFPCQDAMSGEDYPSTVEIVIDGRTLSGCGRSV